MTSPVKHTPGPWKYCTGGDGICKCGCIMDDEAHIAEVFGPFHLGDGIDGPNPVPDREHQRANMLLIAAAPLMYAEIEKAQLALIAIGNNENWNVSPEFAAVVGGLTAALMEADGAVEEAEIKRAITEASLDWLRGDTTP